MWLGMLSDARWAPHTRAPSRPPPWGIDFSQARVRGQGERTAQIGLIAKVASTTNATLDPASHRNGVSWITTPTAPIIPVATNQGANAHRRLADNP